MNYIFVKDKMKHLYRLKTKYSVLNGRLFMYRDVQAEEQV